MTGWGVHLSYTLGRPLAYLTFSLMALIGDPIYTHIFQRALGANPVL